MKAEMARVFTINILPVRSTFLPALLRRTSAALLSAVKSAIFFFFFASAKWPKTSIIHCEALQSYVVWEYCRSFDRRKHIRFCF